MPAQSCVTFCFGVYTQGRSTRTTRHSPERFGGVETQLCGIQQRRHRGAGGRGGALVVMAVMLMMVVMMVFSEGGHEKSAALPNGAPRTSRAR